MRIVIIKWWYGEPMGMVPRFPNAEPFKLSGWSSNWKNIEFIIIYCILKYVYCHVQGLDFSKANWFIFDHPIPSKIWEVTVPWINQTKFGCVKIDKKLDLATSYGNARCQIGEDSWKSLRLIIINSFSFHQFIDFAW